jgi:hypothetical protein
MYGRTSKHMTKAYKALEKAKKARAKKKAAETLMAANRRIKPSLVSPKSDKPKRFKKLKDPKRKLKKDEMRGTREERLKTLRKSKQQRRPFRR